MELRLKFNEDEQNYDRFRPGYPDALMQDVIESFHAGTQSRIMEIGIGTGQATQPILDTGCDLTAVELMVPPNFSQITEFVAYSPSSPKSSRFLAGSFSCLNSSNSIIAPCIS